jgi:exonuclease III
MRILSWNIRHGARSRVNQVLERLRSHEPDLVVLCEFRNNDAGCLIRRGLERMGLVHQRVGNAHPRINTVLIASRTAVRSRRFDGLNAEAHRCVACRVNGMNLLGLYFPNQQAKAPIFEFLLNLNPNVFRSPSMLIGDFNTGKPYVDEARDTFFCSEHFTRLEQVGWVDVWRHLFPTKREYTWYSTRGNGFRIDHAFVSPTLLPKVRRVAYSHKERESGDSDHSLLMVDIG